MAAPVVLFGANQLTLPAVRALLAATLRRHRGTAGVTHLPDLAVNPASDPPTDGCASKPLRTRGGS
jgi:hypothetical protein